jgi:predicted DNA-binding transcriptional regulator YafY
MSPTARALRTLEILQGRPGMTADQLAALLGVTERAARRYVAILREAGIPVEAARGPYGGYRLGRGTRLPPVVFTEEQALGLVMAVLDGQPAAIDADDLVGAALSKVIRALPESIGRQAAALRAYASAAPDRHASRPDPATTSALVAAVADRRRVVVTYRGEGGGEAWDAEVDPWAVVVRFGRWYLLCHSHRAGAVRTYRVDRIRAVRQTPTASPRPPTSTRSPRWRRTSGPAGATGPGWSSTRRGTRSRRGSARRWAAWSPTATAAC